ncbi:MAG: hypothetical protein ABIE22_02780 [archaeon]
MNKKGISEIVTVILIILLSITAVIIIWQVISPLIARAGTSALSADCFTADLEVVNATIGASQITVKRNTGEARLYKLVVLVQNGEVETIENNGTDIAGWDYFTTKTIILGGALVDGDIVKLAPIIKEAGGGDEFQCNPLGSYTAR